MALLLLLPVIISLLLLGAHLMRAFGPAGAGVSLIAIIVLLIPRPWAARLMRIVLIVAALEWIRTAFILIMDRTGAERLWMRMAVILGAVALFTAASTLVFFSKTLRRRYRLDGGGAPEGDNR